MTEEPDDDETETPAEAGYYVPEPIHLWPDEFIIFDKFDFEKHFDCYAALNSGGQLFVLQRSTHTWVSVESFGKPPKPDRPAGIKSVK